MNNATEACRMYVERIKELEALLAAGTLEHDKRVCEMHDINTRMQARIDDLEARNAAYRLALEIIATDDHPCVHAIQATAQRALREEKP